MQAKNLDKVYVLSECKPMHKKFFIQVNQDLGLTVATTVCEISDLLALE